MESDRRRPGRPQESSGLLSLADSDFKAKELEFQKERTKPNDYSSYVWSSQISSLLCAGEDIFFFLIYILQHKLSAYDVFDWSLSQTSASISCSLYWGRACAETGSCLSPANYGYTSGTNSALVPDAGSVLPLNISCSLCVSAFLLFLTYTLCYCSRRSTDDEIFFFFFLARSHP